MEAPGPSRNEILKGFSTHRRSKCNPSNEFKDVDGNVVNFKELVGKPAPDVLWRVPTALLTTELREQTMLKIAGSGETPGILGVGTLLVLMNEKVEPPVPTGEVVFRVTPPKLMATYCYRHCSTHTHIRILAKPSDRLVQVSCLSPEGARRLSRGWATTLDEKPRSCALMIQANLKVAGKNTKTRQVRSLNSIEVWMNTEHSAKRMELWKALDTHARQIKIPENLFLNEEGKSTAEGGPTAIKAGVFVKEWFAGLEHAMVRRMRPPAAHVETSDDGRERLRFSLALKPGSGKKFGWAESELACNADLCWRMEIPFGVTSIFKEAALQAGVEMGIPLSVQEHAFAPVALEDTFIAWNKKVPIKGGQKDEKRVILKVVCIPTQEDPGVTHPSELAGWLLDKCGIHYIGAVCDTQNVAVDESALVMAFLFFVLVDRPISMLTKLSYSSTAVTVRKWVTKDSLKLL